MRHSLFFIAILLFAQSCANHPTVISEDVEALSFGEITKDKKMPSADIISEIRYIPLETTDNAMLMDIQDIRIDSGLFFILDSQPGLFVFDSLGVFKNTIGRKGNGPGEYIHIYSFYIDRNNKQVGVMDNYKRKTLKYDYEGNYLGEISYAEAMLFPFTTEMTSDNILLCHYPIPSGYMDSPYEYQLLKENDEQYEIVEDIVNYRIKNPTGLMSGSNKTISYSKERMLFAPHFSTMIYAVKGQKIVPEYQVATSKEVGGDLFFKSNEEKDYFDLSKEMANQNLFTGINKIIETDQYLLLLTEHQYTCIWDKELKKGIRFDGTVNNLNYHELLMASSFHATDNHYVIGYSTPPYFLDKKEDIEKNTDNNLKKLIADLTEDSNPVILIYTLKTNIIDTFLPKQ
ncbi:thioredoxin-related protein [Parabacteroides sp. PFB2-10]|uniref:6-bladed beta-propeller n=1 Tax=Parabacteroides sp. PFB2-10 TaxID=1742405 RepID=UPI002476795E|nr:6-bladed beta-propeller [Parabacteroides sp. PFB2-10]MDH6312232.1 thioredoxin-related protein [Parabacteroides sp. PFB2-10]